MEDFEILFVDDDTRILQILKGYFSKKEYNIRYSENGSQALSLIKNHNFDIVFTDLNMPGINGIDLLKSVKEYRPETEVVIMTGFGTIDNAVQALKLGCHDFLQKPINFDHLTILIDRIIEKKKLKIENILLKRRLIDRYNYDEVVGVSLPMQKVYEIVDKISSQSPIVLIQGESGTGKEIIATLIHKKSNRKNKPFIPVNCGAIAEGLMESELFGHIKGAFTGAVRSNEGLFKAANSGTIFLDEITEIPLSLQVKLLRVLQEKKIRPVGSTREFKIDVRIIAASNKNLEKSVKDGSLRNDLYYRLNVISIELPPLKTRKADIPLLLNHFLNKYNTRTNKNITSISKEATDILLNYDWPGNVRQLENMVKRAFALGVDDVIELDDLPSEIKDSTEAPADPAQNLSLQDNEILLIKKALKIALGNKADAADLLGINLSTVYRKMEKYGI